MILLYGGLRIGRPCTTSCAARPAREPHVRLRIVAQRRYIGPGLGRDVVEAGLRIEAAALPERAAGAARVVPGALGAVWLDLRRRREHRAQAILLGDADRFGAQLGREIDQIVLVVALVLVRGGLGRMRLRRPGALAGHVACGHRTLLDRPHRLTGDAIEHIGKALLGKLHQRFHRPAVDGHVDERRRGRKVVVPDVVMRDLIMPDALAGLESTQTTELANRLLPIR